MKFSVFDENATAQFKPELTAHFAPVSGAHFDPEFTDLVVPPIFQDLILKYT